MVGIVSNHPHLLTSFLQKFLEIFTFSLVTFDSLALRKLSTGRELAQSPGDKMSIFSLG